jgi:hypothetical protein
MMEINGICATTGKAAGVMTGSIWSGLWMPP